MCTLPSLIQEYAAGTSIASQQKWSRYSLSTTFVAWKLWPVAEAFSRCGAKHVHMVTTGEGYNHARITTLPQKPELFSVQRRPQTG